MFKVLDYLMGLPEDPEVVKVLGGAASKPDSDGAGLDTLISASGEGL